MGPDGRFDLNNYVAPGWGIKLVIWSNPHPPPTGGRGGGGGGGGGVGYTVDRRITYSPTSHAIIHLSHFVATYYASIMPTSQAIANFIA